MSELEDHDGEDDFLHYLLTLVVAGPNYRDIVELTAEDVAELQPSYEDHNGLTYERYPGDEEHEYVEVRFDYIVVRRLELVRKRPEPVPATGPEHQDGMTIIRPGGDT